MSSRINNIKLVAQTLSKSTAKKFQKSTKIPSHLKHYPNMHFQRGSIINFYYKMKTKPDFSNFDNLPLKLQFRKKRVDAKITEVRPLQHAHVNFKDMPGNEIILNMMNLHFFRNSELVNCVYEFSKRIHLPENEELSEKEWDQHPYVGKVFNLILKKLPTFNLKQLITASIAFDKIKCSEKTNIWSGLVRSADRLMHKLSPKDIVLFLRILNRSNERTDMDFIHKLMTIMPIHVDKLRDRELLTLLEVISNLNLQNERLLKYFIYPRLEKRIVRFSFDNYITSLNLLASLQYEEDLVFWNDHVLPSIFNFDYSRNQVKLLWDTLLKVKVNCPLVNISRHILLVENIIKQFDNLKKSGKDITGMLLKLEKDLSLIPSASKEKLTLSELKEAEKRLKDQNILKQFMDNVNSQTDAEGKSKAALESLNKVIEIKDWKKAKYELNLVEVEKLREAKEQKKELRKKKTLQVEVPADGVTAEKATIDSGNVAAAAKKVEKVIDVAEVDESKNDTESVEEVNIQKGKSVKNKKSISKKEESGTSEEK